MTRRIPATGINLFQLIYVLMDEYTQRTGQKPLNLSLGNPDGIPASQILEVKARFAKDPGYDFHTYAEDKNLNRFCEGMIEVHTGLKLEEHPHLKAVPIAGIKTATALMPLACGMHLPDRTRREKFTVVSNAPAYDVIGTWSTSYLGTKRVVWPLSSQDNMRLNLDRLKAALTEAQVDRPDLVFVIRPGNPAATGASKEEWKKLIEFCIERGSRLVNDAAYVGLADPAKHTSLASVAKDYPELEWAEMYSVSKSFNDPGARLGCMIGSKEFIEDFTLIKGNTDSGPVPSVMAAYGQLFQDVKLARKILGDLRQMYDDRLRYLVPQLKKAGFQPACETDAGFFTLWKTPRSVFGIDLAKKSKETGTPIHELFNRTVISETGIVGVHFMSDEPLIRYAVCTDVLNPEFQSRFESQLQRLQIQM